jgi:membrane-bound lytic murein transglycosylase B
MGVAQFMPDTWNAYKARVASATGHNPPNPWNLTDGVMAMAKKLSMVPGVTSGNRSAWKKAATLYLGTSYAPYINGILYWADHYKELL